MKKIANVETATRFITLPRLFRSRFVDESRQGLDLIFFQFQIRHLRRFDTRIGEKFFQIVLLEPLARQIKPGIYWMLRVHFQMAVATNTTLRCEQSKPTSRE